MSEISRLAIVYESRGAEEAEKKDKRLRDNLMKTASSAKKGTTSTMRWMDANKTALIAIGTATAALLAGIIRSSPTLSAELSSVRMAFSMLAFEIGESLAPMFIKLEELAWSLSDSFAALPHSIKLAIGVTILLTGVLALLLVGIVAVSVAAPLIAAAGITAGMLATVAAAILLIGVLAGLEAEYGFLGDTLESVKRAFDTAFMAIEKLGSWMAGIGLTVLNGFSKAFEMVFNTIKAVVATAILLVYFLLTGQFGKIGELFVKFTTRIRDIWGDTWKTVVSLATEAAKKIMNTLRPLPGKVLSILNQMGTKAFWKDLFIKIGIRGYELITSFQKGIGNAGQRVWDYFKEKMGYFTSRLVAWSEGEIGMSPTLIQIGKMIVQSLISGMGNAGQKIWDALKGKMSVLKDGFKKLTKDAKTWGSDFAKNFTSGIGKMEGAAESAKKTLTDKLSFDRRVNDMMVFKWGVDAAKFMSQGLSAGFSAFDLSNTPITNVAASPVASPAGASSTTILQIAEGAFVFHGMSPQSIDTDQIVDGMMEKIETRLGGRL